MNQLPNHIVKKVEQYQYHCKKAEQLKSQIEFWFKKKRFQNYNVNYSRQIPAKEIRIMSILESNICEGNLNDTIQKLEKELLNIKDN